MLYLGIVLEISDWIILPNELSGREIPVKNDLFRPETFILVVLCIGQCLVLANTPLGNPPPFSVATVGWHCLCLWSGKVLILWLARLSWHLLSVLPPPTLSRQWRVCHDKLTGADFWGGDATKHCSVKTGFSVKRGEAFSEWGFGKDFYRKGNAVKRSGPLSEPPDSENWKVVVPIPFVKIGSWNKFFMTNSSSHKPLMNRHETLSEGKLIAK